jgi:hypothetical protein
MHRQLEAIRAEYDAASARLDGLVSRVPAQAWFTRPAPDRWSPGECIDHINKISVAGIGAIRAALPRAEPLPTPRRLRHDPVGWFLWRIMPPPVRMMRVRSKPQFVPNDVREIRPILDEFARLQTEQLELLAAADGRAIDRVMIVSPVDPRAKYNLFSCFGILARHELRHLWQAEQSLPASGGA